MMPCWKFYVDENNRHGALVRLHVPNEEAHDVAFRLYAKHIAKPSVAGLDFKVSKRIKNGYMQQPEHHDGYRYLVMVPHCPDLLIIAHELAHVWQHALTGKTRHNKEMAGLVDKLCDSLYTERWGQ
jgi:hypothetical protein